MSLLNRISNAWNAFLKKESPKDWLDRGVTSTFRPDSMGMVNFSRSQSLITPIYNRISMDVADVPIKHVRVDPTDDRFIEEIHDEVNDCLTLSANLDQTGRAFIQDLIFSMFDEGVVAILPVETDKDPEDHDGIKISNWRCGRIEMWAPGSVKIYAYNELTGQKQSVWMKKEAVAIIQNPFYDVMNAPNSVLQRLLHKMALLDKIDNDSATGKLDLIIQLPYTVRSKSRMEQARMRRSEIIQQLTEQKYGIAYTDGTEKITQLNRPIENNLPKQIEDLWKQLYDNLYMSPEILNGTANEQTMTNYYTRVIVPCLDAIIDELNRKFLSKTARSQGQRFRYYRNYFKLVPVEKMADIADKFTRNEIMSSNEIRQIVGLPPVNTQEAEELRNKNLNRSDQEIQPMAPMGEMLPEEAPQYEPPAPDDGYSDDDYGFH